VIVEWVLENAIGHTSQLVVFSITNHRSPINNDSTIEDRSKSTNSHRL